MIATFVVQCCAELQLDGKIMLYNPMRKYFSSPNQIGIESFINPFFDEPGRTFLDRENSRICFDGLYEDTNGSRCIPAVTNVIM